MTRKNIFCFYLLGFVCNSGMQAQQGYKPKPSIYAVVIGISNYKDKNIPPLQSAEKDANDFYNVLLSPSLGSVPKDNITLITGAKATRSKVLNEVVKTFRKANAEDLIIFYFSGHGKSGESENVGYLLGYDTEDGQEPGTAINMQELKEKIDASKAKLKLSYVDACHAGLFKKKGSKGTGDDNGLADVVHDGILNASEGNAVFLASKAHQNSREYEQVGGVFTYYLIQGLKGEADKSRPGTKGYNNKVVTVGEMDTYLNDKIAKYTNFEQQPFIEYTCEEDFPLSILDPKISLSDIISKADGHTAKTKLVTTDQNSKKDTAGVPPTSFPDEPMSQTECFTSVYSFGKYYLINNFEEPLLLYYTTRPDKRFTLLLAPGEKILSPLLYVGRVRNYVSSPEIDNTEFFFRTVDESKPLLYGTLLLEVKACTIRTKVLSKNTLLLSATGKRKK